MDCPALCARSGGCCMTWLTPGLAGLAAAITIPSLLILYFLKLRRRDVEVSTTLLWKKSIQDLQANAPFQRLRKNILLFLQLLILAAALLAIAQPQFRASAINTDTTVLFIDRSASMATMDETDDEGNPISRLARAKLDAIAFVEALSEGGVFEGGKAGEAMVIAFDTSAQVVQPFTTQKNAPSPGDHVD